MSQSLSGWDGVFHYLIEVFNRLTGERSQSLSGWDGVFHEGGSVSMWEDYKSQSLSGWDGVFHFIVWKME